MCTRWLLVLLLTTVVSGRYGFRFSNTIGDNMVLQQAPLQAQVYGFADGTPGKKVTVRLINETSNTILQEVTTETITEDGITWAAQLAPVPGGFQTYLVTATLQGVTLSMSNVLFGDVFLCSGQSNMMLPVIQAVNASQEILAADQYPFIRVMTTDNSVSGTQELELLSIRQRWEKATQFSIGGPKYKFFSATCWFFGKRIYDSKQYPIGLIASAWGGTTIRSWMSATAVSKCPAPVIYPKDWQFSVLWNAKIYPFTRMAIKSFVWYQGESDAMDHRFAPLYACAFPVLISDWRSQWHTRAKIPLDTPFGFIQISSWSDNDQNPCTNDACLDVAVVRHAQLANYRTVPNELMPNTFMSTAVDLGDSKSPWKDYHSRYKQIASYRLAEAAENVVYGQNTYWMGPVPTSAVFNGTDIIVAFNNVSSSLWVQNSAGFEYQLSSNPTDFGWEYVTATVSLLSNDTISIPAKVSKGQEIKQVRYAWYRAPCFPSSGPVHCALYDHESMLPAIPFLIDVSATDTCIDCDELG